ncbi:MAG: VOC family protein [Conexivisphaerales archaeon]
MVVINHLGIVVKDLDKAVKIFGKTFGLKVKEKSDYPELGMKVVIMEAENINLELIEPTGPGPYWNSGRITSHFNHIAFDVNTLTSFRKKAAKNRVSILPNKRRLTNGGYLVSVDSKTTLGLPIQLIVKHGKREFSET